MRRSQGFERQMYDFPAESWIFHHLYYLVLCLTFPVLGYPHLGIPLCVATMRQMGL
jgi:hypothetical protein